MSFRIYCGTPFFLRKYRLVTAQLTNDVFQAVLQWREYQAIFRRRRHQPRRPTASQDQARQASASDGPGTADGDEKSVTEWKRQLSPSLFDNILWIRSLFIAETMSCSISSAIFKSRDIASSASSPITGKASGISLVRSSPSWRIISSTLNEGVPGVACATPLAWAVCATPRPEPGRRRLMRSLEHVTWRDPRVTPIRLAISSRLTPCVSKFLTSSRTLGVNLTRLPLGAELPFVVVMDAIVGVPPASRLVTNLWQSCHASNSGLGLLDSGLGRA
jgi:hypothetical protein